jgi:DNA ligase-1
MRQFTDLVNRLGASTKTQDKIGALSDYFLTAPEKDKVWVIALFSGRRPKKAVNSTQLREWCLESCALPGWLFDECYHTVGDLAETIALLLPVKSPPGSAAPLHYYLDQLRMMEGRDLPARKQFILGAWREMDSDERFVFNKFITGGFRIGVSQASMVNALAHAGNLEPAAVAHRITGNWDPGETSWTDLMSSDQGTRDISQPYPFYLAYALDLSWEELGDPQAWQAEWKWDGIRGQLVKRQGRLFVWSRGEELLTEKFPEFTVLANSLPDGVVLDGEIACFAQDRAGEPNFLPMPFASLQTRIGRKNITRKQLTEAPAFFIAYDLLEYQDRDYRQHELTARRQILEQVVAMVNHPVFRLSPVIPFAEWTQLAALRKKSRAYGCEGIMLKRKSSSYLSGRKRGDWWKWKIDPLVIDAVMVYAQKGHGRRSNLYTDYTFAVRNGEQLVPFAKAYSGLTDQEFSEVDAFVKRNSLEKFGPVRTVRPELVFEIAFEGIAASKRHRSGVALRFPRINRWRRDKPVAEINSLDDLLTMLRLYGQRESEASG